ncbi:DUF7940 domain-containing protein [Nitrosomonas eutropha]|uniref:Holin n=2 Tax=Nitrosomonas eutropha TaxID=916 RepID=A0ABX5M9D4_9PROT|nr:hypothetical protein [Nitrosomonas eutropha]ABI59696.1 hypothetical protein Neut_1450 [Nitrosomonas eutropha C91]PXV82505.1 hypothetical protein C8R14_10777 [Nitrosomonas eutropha]
MELISGWRTWWKQISTWMVAAGSSIVAFAPELMEIWRSLPIEVQASFPVEWIRAFGLSLVIASIPAKLIRQRKLYEQAQDDLYAE